MSQRIVFFDTSYIVALENRDDPHHSRAKQIDRQLIAENAVLLLHWGILLEIGDGYARIGRREKGMRLIERIRSEQGYQLFAVTDSILDAAIRLYCARPDKEWGLTDCVSFAVMNQEGIVEALTADEHFRQAGMTPLLLD